MKTRHLGVPYSEYRIGFGQRWLICGTESPYSKLVSTCDECPIRFKCWTISEYEEVPITKEERLLFKLDFGRENEDEGSLNS